jgi:hypothetical protein
MGAACDPGMRGCTLHGKVRFASDAQNAPRKPTRAQPVKAPSPPPKRRLPI